MSKTTMNKSENGPFLPVRAWACVCKEKSDPHLYTFSNGFGIYPKREDAESLAKGHGNAYKVVRVVISEPVPHLVAVPRWLLERVMESCKVNNDYDAWQSLIALLDPSAFPARSASLLATK